MQAIEQRMEQLRRGLGKGDKTPFHISLFTFDVFIFVCSYVDSVAIEDFFTFHFLSN